MSPVVQVVVLQAYKNFSKRPIEAKYVFPLDDMAAGTYIRMYICMKYLGYMYVHTYYV